MTYPQLKIIEISRSYLYLFLLFCMYVHIYVFQRCCQGSPGFMYCVAPNILSTFWYLLCPWSSQWRESDRRFRYVAALAISQNTKNNFWRIVSFSNSFSDFLLLVLYLYSFFILEFCRNQFSSCLHRAPYFKTTAPLYQFVNAWCVILWSLRVNVFNYNLTSCFFVSLVPAAS